jgi:hypothetical protein
MAKIAAKDGVIKGILLHQGETDAYDREWQETVTYVVSSEGCLPCDDYLHFCGEGYRILGRHYAQRYLEATIAASHSDQRSVNPQLTEAIK